MGDRLWKAIAADTDAVSCLANRPASGPWTFAFEGGAGGDLRTKEDMPMAILSKERICLRASAEDKTDAIRKAGALLVSSGCVLPEYVDGMLAREQSMSTSLGNGVAIPHGIYENRGHIVQTGISVLQLTDGVQWDEGETVYMVIGIAATSDEHVGVLSNLADVIDDEDTLSELLRTDDPEIILKYLGERQST